MNVIHKTETLHIALWLLAFTFRTIAELVSDLMSIYCPLQFFNGLLVSFCNSTLLYYMILHYNILYNISGPQATAYGPDTAHSPHSVWAPKAMYVIYCIWPSGLFCLTFHSKVHLAYILNCLLCWLPYLDSHLINTATVWATQAPAKVLCLKNMITGSFLSLIIFSYCQSKCQKLFVNNIDH